MITFENVSAGYYQEPVLENISFTVPKGSIVALVGPNGCGKTTLLKAAAGQLTPLAGTVLLNGRSIRDYDRRELARTVAVLPQIRDVPAITVGALVRHGRYPYLGLSRTLRPEDRSMVEQAMEAAGVSQWENRDLRELSGGERQRAYVAMALAQDTDLILLDEPTTFLDIGHQFELLELIQSLNHKGKTILMVLHDLSHALGYSHKIALLDQGTLIQYAPGQELLENGALSQVFGVTIRQNESGITLSPQKNSIF